MNPDQVGVGSICKSIRLEPSSRLNSAMERPTHTFKIGQQVYDHAGGLPGGKRTGPYTVVGVVRQSSDAVLYRIKNSRHEQLAHESELRLALRPTRVIDQ
jgi:hypothetical protein